MSWRTDRNLMITGVTQWPGVAIRALPVPGQIIVKTRGRTGFLETEAHLRALAGESTRYRFTLFRRKYVVQLAPRRDRRRRIIGVQGFLLKPTTGRADGDPSPRQAGEGEPELQSLRRITLRRRKNTVESAIRSLQLAKAVAETVRLNAEYRYKQAVAQEQKALDAQNRAEAEERRARFLSEASIILDSSFDQENTLNRLGKLLVLRVADWCVLYLRRNSRVVRCMMHHRSPEGLKILGEAYPEVIEEGPPTPSARYQSELFPSVTPEVAAALLPAGPRRAAFRKMGVQSMIRTAVSSHGREIGVLLVGSDDPGRLFDSLDLRMARDLASRIALAREASTLFEEAQREIALRREAEARLRVFNVELEHRIAERTAMLEEAIREANSFAYTVAHDLRAPLRAITGFCQALHEDYGGAVDAVGKDYLDRIISGAQRMDHLIRDLLDYARLNRAEIRKGIVDLDQLIEEVLQPMAPELEERKARVEVEKPLGRVVGQGGVLGQALTNIVSNAVKFVAEGVTPEVRPWTERKDDRVRLFVQDNGIGIAPEHHERIFGIFERLNRAEQYPGTGIGLAIVRRAVERLGGGVGVDSAVGQGSRFWIELPTV